MGYPPEEHASTTYGPYINWHMINQVWPRTNYIRIYYEFSLPLGRIYRAIYNHKNKMVLPWMPNENYQCVSSKLIHW